MIRLIEELKKIFLLSWDPYYTKVTVAERIRMQKTDAEFRKGVYITEDEFGK